VKCFYKIKKESSKVSFETDEEWEAYIAAVFEREGIMLRRSDFEENPGRRQLTKLMLNNLWGRYGMRQNLAQTEFTTKFSRIKQLDADPTIEMTSIRPVSDYIAQVSYKKAADEYIEMRKDTNIFVAIATTAWARIRLYRELDKLKERAVYCDTDSVIYLKSPVPEENLQCGDFLGDLTSELNPGDHIVDFVSGGPKNYGYVTEKGSSCVKVRGITMNCVNAPALKFQNIKKVILNGVKNQDFVPEDDEDTGVGESGRRTKRLPKNERLKNNKMRRVELQEQLDQEMDESQGALAVALASDDVITTLNRVQITRTREWKVVQKKNQKLYSFWFDKRIVLSDFDSIPFGYVKS
jgi:hypothetical protein